MASSKKSSIDSPLPAGGDVSHGKQQMEITGDIELDRARDHVLHDAMHGPHDKAFGLAKEGAGGKLGGGDVSAGKQDFELTGDIDLDRARDHVLQGTMHGPGDKGFSQAKSRDGRLGGGDVSGGKKEFELTGAQDLDRAREHVLGYK
jgi:hypothetical protein